MTLKKYLSQYQELVDLLSDYNLVSNISDYTIKNTFNSLSSIRENIIKSHYKLPPLMINKIVDISIDNSNETVSLIEIEDDYSILTKQHLQKKVKINKIKELSEQKKLMFLPISFSDIDISKSNIIERAKKIGLHLFVLTTPKHYNLYSHFKNSDSFNFNDILIGDVEIKKILSSAFLTLPILKLQQSQIEELYRLSNTLNDRINSLSDNIKSFMTPVIDNLSSIVIEHSKALQRDNIKKLMERQSKAEDWVRKEYLYSNTEYHNAGFGDEGYYVETPVYKNVTVSKEVEKEEIQQQIDNIRDILNKKEVNLKEVQRKLGIALGEGDTEELVIELKEADRNILINLFNSYEDLLDFETEYYLLDNQNLSEAKVIFKVNI